MSQDNPEKQQDESTYDIHGPLGTHSDRTPLDYEYVSDNTLKRQSDDMADTTTSSMFSESELLGTSTQNEDIHSRHDETSSSEQDSTLEADSQGESASPTTPDKHIPTVRDYQTSPSEARKPASPNKANKTTSPHGANQSASPNGANQSASTNGVNQLASPDGATQTPSPSGAAPTGTKETKRPKKKGRKPRDKQPVSPRSTRSSRNKAKADYESLHRAEEKPNRKKHKTTLQTTQPTKKSIDWKHR